MATPSPFIPSNLWDCQVSKLPLENRKPLRPVDPQAVMPSTEAARSVLIGMRARPVSNSMLVNRCWDVITAEVLGRPSATAVETWAMMQLRYPSLGCGLLAIAADTFASAWHEIALQAGA